jgi:hypothetical protein
VKIIVGRKNLKRPHRLGAKTSSAHTVCRTPMPSADPRDWPDPPAGVEDCHSRGAVRPLDGVRRNGDVRMSAPLRENVSRVLHAPSVLHARALPDSSSRVLMAVPWTTRGLTSSLARGRGVSD